jgi:hypothetical protein
LKKSSKGETRKLVGYQLKPGRFDCARG